MARSASDHPGSGPTWHPHREEEGRRSRHRGCAHLTHSHLAISGPHERPGLPAALALPVSAEDSWRLEPVSWPVSSSWAAVWSRPFFSRDVSSLALPWRLSSSQASSATAWLLGSPLLPLSPSSIPWQLFSPPFLRLSWPSSRPFFPLFSPASQPFLLLSKPSPPIFWPSFQLFFLSSPLSLSLCSSLPYLPPSRVEEMTRQPMFCRADYDRGGGAVKPIRQQEEPKRADWRPHGRELSPPAADGALDVERHGRRGDAYADPAR